MQDALSAACQHSSVSVLRFRHLGDAPQIIGGLPQGTQFLSSVWKLNMDLFGALCCQMLMAHPLTGLNMVHECTLAEAA